MASLCPQAIAEARDHHLEHCVPDAIAIAAIRHRLRKPPAHPELALCLSQQQQTGIRRLIAAVKINCEFLALNRWKVEGKQRIVGHGGCGAGLIREATRPKHRFAYVNRPLHTTVRLKFLCMMPNPG
jgi:hypothetical protein